MTARTICVDGFTYSTTAPVRLRRQSSAVEHYAALAAQARATANVAPAGGQEFSQ